MSYVSLKGMQKFSDLVQGKLLQNWG